MLALFIAGLVGIVAGVSLIYPPAGVIVGGVLAVAVSLMYSRGESE